MSKRYTTPNKVVTWNVLGCFVPFLPFAPGPLVLLVVLSTVRVQLPINFLNASCLSKNGTV